jgi:hypothetical protein
MVFSGIVSANFPQAANVAISGLIYDLLRPSLAARMQLTLGTVQAD